MSGVTRNPARSAIICDVTAKSVLVVDDDVYVRELLVQRLRNRGFVVDSSDSADSALRKLSASTYDVLLLDLIMPREGGTVVLDSVTASANAPRCIVMSGVADLWHKANPGAIVAGVLQKPFDLHDLLKLLADA